MWRARALVVADVTPTGYRVGKFLASHARYATAADVRRHVVPGEIFCYWRQAKIAAEIGCSERAGPARRSVPARSGGARRQTAGATVRSVVCVSRIEGSARAREDATRARRMAALMSYLTSGLVSYQASYQASGLIQNHVQNHQGNQRGSTGEAPRASCVSAAGIAGLTNPNTGRSAMSATTSQQ